MGIEYKIRFEVSPDYNPGKLFSRLPSPIGKKTTWEIYNYCIDSDGFYFVNHLVDQTIASFAFRLFIDEALSCAQSIEILEP